MKRLATITAIAVAVLTLGSAHAAPLYTWSLTNPSQLAAYRVPGAVLTVAEVRLANTCQAGFIVPMRMKFTYQIKIRTRPGMCAMIVRNVLISFLERGTAANVHAQMLSGTRTVPVQNPPVTGPSP